MVQERDKIIDEIFNDFRVIGRTAKRGMKPSAGIGRPSPAQIEMINIISGRGSVTVKEIAETMRVSGSAVTQFADPLVEAGLIERHHDARDRRIVNIKMSPAGRRELSALETHGREHLAMMFETLSNEELETMRDLHRKVIDNIVNINGQGNS